MSMGRVYAGTSGWAYKTWSPDFYPKSVKAADYLAYYSSQLNAVEAMEFIVDKIQGTKDNNDFLTSMSQ